MKGAGSPLHQLSEVGSSSAGLTPVTGEAPRLSMDQGIAAYWIAWCAGETHPALRLEPSAAFEPPLPKVDEGIKTSRKDGRLEIEFEGMNARWTQFAQLRTVFKLFSDAPDGSILELCASNQPPYEEEDPEEDSDKEAGWIRFRGTIMKGQWRIEQTYPGLDGKTLRQMLDLGLEAELGTGFKVKSKKEGEAILESARKHDFLLRQSMPILEGLILKPSKKDLAPFLAARVFLQRFAKNISSIARDNDLSDWDEMMDLLPGQLSGEMVYEGRWSKFGQARIEELGPESANSRIASYKAELADLEFSWLGEVQSTKTGKAIFAGFRHPQSVCYASINHSMSGKPNLDLVTRFQDGHWLITSDGGWTSYN